MKNFLKIVLIIFALLALFGGELFGEYAVYAKVIGLCLLMFLVFTVSSKLSSKKDTSENLKL